MHTDVFLQLGLAKNEALIYETLLKEGESSVSHIAAKSKVNRRNVYDSLNRLVDRGLVYEIVAKNENRYQAVAPSKLMEIISEKERVLSNVMPELEAMYNTNTHEQEIYSYRGEEGWKNYMIDMLRIANEAHFIGAKGGWLDEKVKNFFPHFLKESEKKKIRFYHLFDHEVKAQLPEIIPKVGSTYRFLPKKYSTNTAIDIFGDRVYIISKMTPGKLSDDFSISVIVNKAVADSFRTWFQMMWDLCPKGK